MDTSASKARRLPPDAARFSYFFMAGLLVLIVWLKLATPLIAGLFTYLALTCLCLPRRGGSWLAVGIFVVCLSGIAYGLGYFLNQTVKALPEIADKSIPSILAWAKAHQIELPFSDYDSLKEVALDTIKGEVKYLGSFARFARGASLQLLFLAAGCVIGISIFLSPSFESRRPQSESSDDLYSCCFQQVTARFALFYRSFVTVMGAQVLISAFNTLLTAFFVMALGLPYAVVVVGMTFLCGLLPVVGNLLSNAVIVGIGFTVSPKMALLALVFLVLVHKLEYFLNSKIVGWRIQNPFWLTLLGLLIGERLLGIPGMILAPVVLNYLRLEGSRLPANRRRSEAAFAETTEA